jgi:hypothetical protein
MKWSFVLFILIPCDVTKSTVAGMTRNKVSDSGIVSCGIIVEFEKKGTS